MKRRHSAFMRRNFIFVYELLRDITIKQPSSQWQCLKYFVTLIALLKVLKSK